MAAAGNDAVSDLLSLDEAPAPGGSAPAPPSAATMLHDLLGGGAAPGGNGAAPAAAAADALDLLSMLDAPASAPAPAAKAPAAQARTLCDVCHVDMPA